MSEEEDILVEAAASAHRAPDPTGRVRFHPSWHDLDDEGRERSFAVATKLRRLEAARDPEGLSSTAKAVLARIRGT